MNYSLVAAHEWLGRHGARGRPGLTVVSWQAGDAVIPVTLAFSMAMAAQMSADKARM